MLADVTNPTGLFDYLQYGGLLAFLILIMWGGKQKWWVFGWYYKELLDRHDRLRQERDDWKNLAIRSTNLAESVNELARYKATP